MRDSILAVMRDLGLAVMPDLIRHPCFARDHTPAWIAGQARNDSLRGPAPHHCEPPAPSRRRCCMVRQRSSACGSPRSMASRKRLRRSSCSGSPLALASKRWRCSGVGLSVAAGAAARGAAGAAGESAAAGPAGACAPISAGFMGADASPAAAEAAGAAPSAPRLRLPPPAAPPPAPGLSPGSTTREPSFSRSAPSVMTLSPARRPVATCTLSTVAWPRVIGRMDTVLSSLSTNT